MSNLWMYVGGKKRTNGVFGYIENGRFRIGHRHVPMTRLARNRFFRMHRQPRFRIGNNFFKYV